jgi:hypothetical protein
MIVLAVVGLSPLVVCAAAQGQDPAPESSPPSAITEEGDRALLYRLVRQVRRVDRETESMMTQAMAEARDNDGQANPETKARLLSLRDERDRLFSRMLILSMRHGWEIPDLDKPAAASSDGAEAAQNIFSAVDVLVRRRFAAEARRIAQSVSLPVVSLESMSK